MASIKESFENKLAAELNLPRVYSLKLFCATKETEKAVYAILYTGYMADGRRAKHRAHWVPKSAIENLESLRIIPDYDEAVKTFDIEYAM